MSKTPKSKISNTTRRVVSRHRKREEELEKDKTPDELIVEEAHDRWNRANDYEADFRNLYKADVKFAWGDSDNLWQWPNDLARRRTQQERPCLTINKVQNHVRLVTNDMRKNKASIDIRPVNNEGSFKAAQIWEGLIRNIEYESGAQAIYDKAGESAVEGGIGYWRITTDYIDDMAFDQRLVIRPIRDQLGVYLDCDIEQVDGLDAEWGFIFSDRVRKEVERENPGFDFKAMDLTNAVGGPDTWMSDDMIREAEYYRIVKKKDRLVRVLDDDNNESTMFESDMPPEMRAQVADLEKNDPDKVQTRKVTRRKLEWFKIVGSYIVDRRDGREGSEELKGKYIPIIRVVGRERVIEGKLERKGLVRGLKDPQRMYNYNSSGQVEYGALATKSPWVGPKSAFSGNEVMWNNANRDNAAYIPFNDWDAENEREIKAPMRPEAPGASPAFLNGMQIAATELDMASGQKQAQQGVESNEVSSLAIESRKRQSDIITFDFLDNMAIAIRATGKVVLDWAPHVYDTKRVEQILGRDGTQSRVLIDPGLQGPDGQKQAYEEKKEKDEVLVYFNPTAGRYEVHSEPGPAYSTQRQEAWNAFVQIVTGAPDLINEIGDLMFQSADFPLADKIAERLLKKIKSEKPYLFDEGDQPQYVQLRQELESMSKQMGEALEALATEKMRNKDMTQRNNVAGYNAETDRVTKLLKTLTDAAKAAAPKGGGDGAAKGGGNITFNAGEGGGPTVGTGQEAALRAVVAQTLIDMLEGEDITPEGTGEADEDEAYAPGAGLGENQPPVPGAERASDGHWYIKNTGPNSKTHPFLRVMQEGMQQMAATMPKAVAGEVTKTIAQNNPAIQANKLAGMTRANG